MTQPSDPELTTKPREVLRRFGVAPSRLRRAGDRRNIHWMVQGPEGRLGKGKLSGILDFDSAHLDLRVADFALSWRGKHTHVIEGYEDESPLEPVERELIVPVYWAWVVACAIGGIESGDATPETTQWAVTHLLRTDLDRPYV